jgi:hypothetical protein
MPACPERKTWPQTFMSSFKNNRIWFLLVPVMTALLVWVPYLIWNIWNQQEFWWRIPIVSGTVFDTFAYLQWLSQAVNGLDISQHLRWFEWPLRALGRIFPNATVAELWLFSRWISITAALWVSGWAVRVWSGLDTGRSRLTALAFWLSFVPVLGMRPGVFSWYLPFGIFCLTAPLHVISGLRRRSFSSAAFWTVAALAASSVYAWFLVVAVVWLASIWSAWLIFQCRKIFFALLAGAAAAAALAAPIAAHWLVLSPSGKLFWDLQLQDGLAFTHVPPVSNTFAAMAVWIVFFIVASKGFIREANADRERRLAAIQWAWISLLLAWLSTFFTGVYFHNDHFRTLVLILSWMSIAALWSSMREGNIRFSRPAIWAFRALCAASAVFVVNILRKPYAFDHDYLNVIHLSCWFTVIMASWLVLRRRAEAAPYAWPHFVIIGSILIGGVGAAAMYQSEFAEMPNRMRYVQTVEWIREHVPVNDAVCSDPVQAELLGAFTGRRTFLSNSTAISRKLITDGLRNMRTYVSGFDAVASGNLEYIRLVNHQGRSFICLQFPMQVKILKAIGISDARIDDMIGCPRELLRDLDEMTMDMVHQPEVDDEAFRAFCPWVVISSDRRAFWRLPGGYQEIPVSSTMSVWHAAP